MILHPSCHCTKKGLFSSQLSKGLRGKFVSLIFIANTNVQCSRLNMDNMDNEMYVVWTDGKPVTMVKPKKKDQCAKSIPSSGSNLGVQSKSQTLPLHQDKIIGHTEVKSRYISSTNKVGNGQLTTSGKQHLHRNCIASEEIFTVAGHPLRVGVVKQQRNCPISKVKKYTPDHSSENLKKLEKEYNALKTKEQEEQVELRRLRTENRLLRQRIDNLEKETSTLADRLIHDQVIRAQQEEEMYVVRRDLSALKSHHEKTTEKLTQANDLVRDLKDRTSSTDSGVSSGSQNDAVITQLQEELINVRLQEAEQKSALRELHDRVRELEELNRRLQQEPNSELQTLQEQLIASKLREAESNLSMKELRQRVTDLDKHWQKHQERSSASPKEKSSKAGMQQLADELMSIKLKEAELVADLNEMKQKVMELETQNHICNRQIKRLQSENETLKEKMDEGTEREKDGRNQIKELERKIADLETKKKEDTVMVRIRDAEHSQMIAEMRQRVAELEIENQELVTAGQLQEKGETQELQNRIADLQEEVMTLKMARKLQSLSSLALNHMGLSLDMESDYDTDDMETTITDSKNFHMNDANSLDSDSLGYDGLNDLAVDTMSNLKKHVTLSDFRGLQHDSQQNHIESATKDTVNSYLPPSSTTVTPTHPSDSESINGATNECSSYVLSENLIQK